MTRWRSIGVATVAVLLQCSAARAVAAPEDDHRRGLEAYHRGDVATAMAALRAPAKAGHAPSQALLAFMLALFPREPLHAVRYAPEEDLRAAAPWFEPPRLRPERGAPGADLRCGGAPSPASWPLRCNGSAAAGYSSGAISLAAPWRHSAARVITMLPGSTCC